MEKKKIITYVFSLLIISIILYFLFSFLLKNEKEDYNYEYLIGNSFVANDNSYLVLNKDKTFYWYKDIDNKDEYYYGTFTIYRGENAIKYISSDLAIYDISEEYQKSFLKDKDIDNYYNVNLTNEKLITNGKEEKLNKVTRYYGIATDNYNKLEFINMDANNIAIFSKKQ